MSLAATILASLTGSYTVARDQGTTQYPLQVSYRGSIEDGVGTGQADLMFDDIRTLAASATEDIDLAGVLSDALGRTVTIVKLKAILIKADAANTNNVVVGGAAATQVTGLFGDVSDKIVVPPGGVFLWAAPKAGIAVGAGATDLLKVANSGAGTGVTYSITVIGCSA